MIKPNFKTKFKFIRRFFSLIILILLSYSLTLAQSNDQCLDCHSDPDISMQKKGKNVSLNVKKFTLARSVHSKLKCVQCHQGFNADDVPHKAKITPINCSSCHQDAGKKHLFHPKMMKSAGLETNASLNCKGCHGRHEVSSPKDPNSKFHFTKLTETCGACHKNEKEQHLKSGHYFAYVKHNPNVPTCIYCHSKPVTPSFEPDEAKHKQKVIDLCLGCHLNNPNVTSKFAQTLVSFEKSVHGSAILKGKKEAAGCVDCHGVHDLTKTEAHHSKINRINVPNVCGKCHISISQEYMNSTHGMALKRGNLDAPGCTYCHGEHNITKMPDVPPRVFEETHIKKSTYVRNKMVYCIVCHADEELSKKNKLLTVSKAHDFLPNQSSHWETVRCVDCHSSYLPPNLSHNILPPEKTIKKCEECHGKNSMLMSKLYTHEKKSSREKFGFINGVLLSDAYVIGTTRNVFLDTVSIFLAAMTIMGIGLHGFMRWYFKRGGKK